MLISVNRENLTRIPESNAFVAEASDLGCGPGVWPDQIVVLGAGNAHFDRHHEERHGEDLSAVIYRSRCGLWDLTLLND